MTDIISIDSNISIPIYRQIVNSINQGIDKGELKMGDMLPSVNQIAAKFSLARGSVFSAFNELRAAGIIDSVPGKGYFITGTQTQQKQNVFLLFSTFTPYKEVLYNALLQQLKSSCTVDIFFHHHNFKVAETLIKEQALYYNTFVIMPDEDKKYAELLQSLPEKKVFLLDSGLKEFGDSYPGVCQNFESDIYTILTEKRLQLEKYTKLYLIFPKENLSKGIVTGFKNFGARKEIPCEVIGSLKSHEVSPGEAYITVDDKDLVTLVQTARQKKFRMGEDIGIVSYNESPLKSIIGEGITTITTDFVEMGKTMADMILAGEKQMIQNPFTIIQRASF